jgi:hypothetical protein
VNLLMTWSTNLNAEDEHQSFSCETERIDSMHQTWKTDILGTFCAFAVELL